MKGKRAKDSIFKNVIFVALAASGKSEVITFIKKMPPEERERELHIGRELVILDDFVYVDLMRRIDEALCQMNENPVFFSDPKKPFKEPHISWKLLIQLLNYDYERLFLSPKRETTAGAAKELLADLDRARVALGTSPIFFQLKKTKFNRLCAALEEKVATLTKKRQEQMPPHPEETTVLFEFARGGEYGSPLPLPAGRGYAASFAAFRSECLQGAVCLYLEVLPEQAALKNFLRADPRDPSSILGHCVPYEVMFRDYGSDDFRHLLKISEKPGCIAVETISQKKFFIPAAILDNKADLTTFVRKYQNQPFNRWPKKDRVALGQALKKACQELWKKY